MIGCGAGPACHAHVIVTHDGIGLTGGGHRPPRFVPELGDLATPMKESFARYVHLISSGEYPAQRHLYEMPEDEKKKLEKQ